jgi:hypothetical protein
MGSGGQGGRAALSAEAVRFARHLLGSDPTPLQVTLYERGVARLHLTEPPGGDLLIRASRIPGFLPFLDAGIAWLRLDCLLRRRLLLMAAILEASPEGAAHFLPRRLSFPWFFLTLAVAGIRSMLFLPLGILLTRYLHRP